MVRAEGERSKEDGELFHELRVRSYCLDSSMIVDRLGRELERVFLDIIRRLNSSMRVKFSKRMVLMTLSRARSFDKKM